MQKARQTVTLHEMLCLVAKPWLPHDGESVADRDSDCFRCVSDESKPHCWFLRSRLESSPACVERWTVCFLHLPAGCRTAIVEEFFSKNSSSFPSRNSRSVEYRIIRKRGNDLPWNRLACRPWGNLGLPFPASMNLRMPDESVSDSILVWCISK